MAAVPDQGGPARPPLPLGQLLIERGFLSEQQLASALEHQARSGSPLGEVLVELGYVPAALIGQALATQHGGLLKTEYGFATGFAEGSTTAPAAPPPHSGPTPVVPTPAAPTEQASAALRFVGAEAPQAPEPEPEPELEAEPEPASEPAVSGHLAFVGSPAGYTLVECPGPPPPVDTIVELPEQSGIRGRHRVLRLSRGTIPGVDAPCVYLLSVD